jgi:hypothetical protein
MWLVEYTDTFGGEANYSWVQRATLGDSEETNRQLAKRFKAEMGLTGVRGRSYWHGDEYEFRPYGMCTVLFARYDDS